MRAALATALVATCAAGAAAFVAGRLLGNELVEEIGAWMTAPLWLVLGVLVVAAAIGQPAAALLRLAQRRRGRRQR